jgi:putative Holliday junction resolvase
LPRSGCLIKTNPINEACALAFDYGERRIGVAFANRITGTATALTTLQARDAAAVQREIDELIKAWQPNTIIIGVPFNLDGSESAMTLKAREFGSALHQRHNLPIDEIDERLTSDEARRLLREQRRAGHKVRRVVKEDIDSLAAQLIGESWLRYQETKNNTDRDR